MQDALKQGTLIRVLGGFYTVEDKDGRRDLRCRKKFRRLHQSPLVGDEVLFSEGTTEDEGWIEQILPRRSECLRPPVANVTLLLAVVAPVPEPDLLLIDRMLVRARAQGMKIALIAAKSDLDAGFADRVRAQYAHADVPVFAVSAAQGAGFEALREVMRGEVCCLTGQSGVGKSTLLNAMLGLRLETGDISERIRRGKNTTRKEELLTAGGLKVLDTAGFSLLELDSGMPPETLKDCYPDFLPYEGRCRFEPCMHDREPGCAVSAAAEAGELDRQRLARYRALLAECRENWKNRYH